MNKNSHRYEPSDYISKIQTNLKEMKEEVSEYLKKHTIDKVPPILRARHYLLIDAINDIGSASQSLKPKKVVKDLSSEKLGHVVQGDRFEPLRECEDEKKQKSKTVKQNRATSIKKQGKNGVQADLNCLLPNICNLKFEFDDQNLSSLSTSGQYFEEKRNKLISRDSFQAQPEEFSKRYQSIDFRQKQLFKKTFISSTKDPLIELRKGSSLENNKSVVRSLKNKSQEKKNFEDEFIQPSKLSQSLKIAEKQLNQQPLNEFNKFQTIRQLSFQQNAKDLNQLLRSSKQFNQHAHTIQRKKIYAKVNKQLEKGSIHKNSTNNTAKKKISLSFIQYGKFGSRQISNKSQLFQPWQGQIEQKEKNEFLLQNQIY